MCETSTFICNSVLRLLQNKKTMDNEILTSHYGLKGLFYSNVSL